MGWHPLRKRREAEFARLDAFRSARRLLDEDISVFAEQLAQLRSDTATSDAGWATREDHQKATEALEQATSKRGQAETAADVDAIDTVLTEGRFHLACVLARRAGVALPARREPCFFNPQHGPAVSDVAWTPQGGVAREVPACRADADRLSAGEPPDVRMVRVGDRHVPWHAVGGSIVTFVQRHEHVAGATNASTDRHVGEGRARGEIANAPWTKI